MPFWLELIVSVFLLVGGVFLLVGSIGLARLPDIYTRLHAPTKATTLGLAGLLIASMLLFSWQNSTLSIHELLIALFLFITAPVSANMIAKTALHHRLPALERTQNQDLAAAARERLTPDAPKKKGKK
ncbi:multisubunit potassium/proton antiporter, PhaG subunit [Oceanospirillum multiglobuliferum]|uniref:Na+/H+ antiporter subunit G n=1 Tax=Oceanospirillum multiglobuliferum TaxID=64969 RepID=A0A1T4NZ68_9GAMM|nr:Na+/H+ antiporter subunit G [Oceanospirillum multiglobuliferum]OPX55072.1 Na+/H+ antiporter subunit G [Oceanospirillum multiglobuliferum]SJZ84469.1 multisubunit potassium/proton antiporter, PhaG subunit [Oceanospirillum multiglobuliferum]